MYAAGESARNKIKKKPHLISLKRNKTMSFIQCRCGKIHNTKGVLQACIILNLKSIREIEEKTESIPFREMNFYISHPPHICDEIWKSLFFANGRVRFSAHTWSKKYLSWPTLTIMIPTDAIVEHTIHNHMEMWSKHTRVFFCHSFFLFRYVLIFFQSRFLRFAT